MGRNEENTALVLCGGASRGALEVGFYKALEELGIGFDRIVGTSIGAFNGAMIAGGMTSREIEALWLNFSLRRAVSWNWGWLAHPRLQPGLFSLNRYRRLLREVLPATRFEDLKLPLTITTTELESGRPVYWSGAGDLIEPLVASMSLPGIFPPVMLNGTLHVDGGIANNVPLDRAHVEGATHAHVIECYCDKPCLRPPRGMIGILMRSFSVALDSKYHADIARLKRRMCIERVQPVFDNNVDLMNFDKSAELIDTGYRATMRHFRGTGAQAASNSASMTGHSGTLPCVH
jgi:NTE family protein